MKTKRTPKKKPPIKIVCAFGPVTPEMIAAMPEHIRRRLAELIFGDFAQCDRDGGTIFQVRSLVRAPGFDNTTGASQTASS